MARSHQDHRRGGEVEAEAHRQRHAIAAEGIAQDAEQARPEGVEDLHHRRRQRDDGGEVGGGVSRWMISGDSVMLLPTEKP